MLVEYAQLFGQLIVSQHALNNRMDVICGWRADAQRRCSRDSIRALNRNIAYCVCGISCCCACSTCGTGECGSWAFWARAGPGCLLHGPKQLLRWLGLNQRHHYVLANPTRPFLAWRVALLAPMLQITLEIAVALRAVENVLPTVLLTMRHKRRQRAARLHRFDLGFYICGRRGQDCCN